MSLPTITSNIKSDLLKEWRRDMEDKSNKNVAMKKTIIAMVPEESPIYKFHPLTRFCFFIVTGFIPLLIDMPEINLLCIFLLMGLFKWSRVQLASLKIYMPMIVTVGIFIFLTYVIFPGDDPQNIPFFKILGYQVYYQPVRWALVTYVRILTLIFASIFYFCTNRERDILAGLRSVGVPFAVSYFFGLALRTVGMFLEDIHTIREAEQARGLDYSVMTLKDKVKYYAMYIIPLFSLALRRGDEMNNALFVRGYSFGGTKDGKKRSDYILTKYQMGAVDKPLIAVFCVAFAALLVIRFKYNLFGVENSIVNMFFSGIL